MADNVSVKNGNSGGTDYTVASDDISNVHYQRIKLVDGTLDSTTAIPGSSSGLFVVPRQDIQTIHVTVAGLTTATTAYSAGDQVGSLSTITNAARATGGTGTILGVSLTDKADIIGSYDVVVFRTSTNAAGVGGLAGDNVASSIGDAAAFDVVEVISLNYAVDLGANRFARLMGLNVPYNCSSDANLYAVLITRTAHTFFTAGDLQLTFYVARD